MRSKAVISAVFAIGTVIVTACGGIDEPDLFSPGGVTTTPHDDAGSTSKDGGNSTVSDAGSGTRDSGSSGGSDGGGAPIDSGSGGGGGPRSIFCETDTCTGTDICCERDSTLGESSASFECTTEAECTSDVLGDTVISCDDAHDCKGSDICCGVFVTGTPSYYSSVSCQPTCGDAADRIFCDPARGNDDCVNGGSCVASGSMPGYHVCGT